MTKTWQLTLQQTNQKMIKLVHWLASPRLSESKYCQIFIKFNTKLILAPAEVQADLREDNFWLEEIISNRKL